jgi:N-acetylglucosaminyldiphosphoundecaprenol N-acetyl-beta-D-mannosaminyltransferase
MISLKVAGVRVDAVSQIELQNEITRIIRNGEKKYLPNVNIHAINIAGRDGKFREFINQSPLVYCDGEGVRLGARLLGVKLPPRIVLTRWIWELCQLCEQEEFSIFLLGGHPEAADKAAENVRRRFPRLKVAGWHHGYFTKTGPELDRVVGMINQARPNILCVCFGMPLQEHWVNDNFSRLNANVFIFGGSAIEYTAGTLKVPPPWMSSNGLEWLHRLFQQPQRLWRRYLLGIPLFVCNVFRQLLSQGWQRGAKSLARSKFPTI